jgi:hypothetical protein
VDNDLQRLWNEAVVTQFDGMVVVMAAGMERETMKIVRKNDKKKVEKPGEN